MWWEKELLEVPQLTVTLPPPLAPPLHQLQKEAPQLLTEGLLCLGAEEADAAADL